MRLIVCVIKHHQITYYLMYLTATWSKYPQMYLFKKNIHKYNDKKWTITALLTDHK